MLAPAALITVRTLEEVLASLPAEQQTQWRWAPPKLARIFAPLQRDDWDDATLRSTTREFLEFALKMDFGVLVSRGVSVADALDELGGHLAAAPFGQVDTAVALWTVAAMRAIVAYVTPATLAGLELLRGIEADRIDSMLEGPAGTLALGYVAACAACDGLDQGESRLAPRLFARAFRDIVSGWHEELRDPFKDETRAARRERLLGYVRLARSSFAQEDRRTAVDLAGAHLGLRPARPNLLGLFIDGASFENMRSFLAARSRDDGQMVAALIPFFQLHAQRAPLDLGLAALHARSLQLAGQVEEAEVAAIRALAVETIAQPSDPGRPELAEVLADAGLVEDAKRVLELLRERELGKRELRGARRVAARLGVRYGELEWAHSYAHGPEAKILLAEGDADAWRLRQSLLEEALEGQVATFDVEVRPEEENSTRLVLRYYTGTTSWSALERLWSAAWDRVNEHERESGRSWNAHLEVDGPYVPLEGMTP